jgi:hypothetical protein
MAIILGLLILGVLFGVPVYFAGLFVVYRWKKLRPGIVFWIVNPVIAVVWISFLLIMGFGEWLKTHNVAQTASSSAASPAPASSTNSSPSLGFNLPPNWDSSSNGTTWDNASEADKEAVAADLVPGSSNQHTAAFFYTNMNANYDPSNANYAPSLPIVVMFMKLDNISPAASYPPMLGFSWKRVDVKHTPQGDVRTVSVFWQDGHTFIHEQKIQPNGSYNFGGPDGPWDGDVATYTATTTVSGNTYTIQTTAPTASTRTGTFQVSADGQELDLTENGKAPVRYNLAAQLVNNIDDVK